MLAKLKSTGCFVALFIYSHRYCNICSKNKLKNKWRDKYIWLVALSVISPSPLLLTVSFSNTRDLMAVCYWAKGDGLCPIVTTEITYNLLRIWNSSICSTGSSSVLVLLRQTFLKNFPYWYRREMTLWTRICLFLIFLWTLEYIRWSALIPVIVRTVSNCVTPWPIDTGTISTIGVGF